MPSSQLTRKKTKFSFYSGGAAKLARLVEPENTHLLCKGKYHCTADLQLDWLGFSCFAYVELDLEIYKFG